MFRVVLRSKWRIIRQSPLFFVVGSGSDDPLSVITPLRRAMESYIAATCYYIGFHWRARDWIHRRLPLVVTSQETYVPRNDFWFVELAQKQTPRCRPLWTQIFWIDRNPHLDHNVIVVVVAGCRRLVIDVVHSDLVSLFFSRLHGIFVNINVQITTVRFLIWIILTRFSVSQPALSGTVSISHCR